MLRSQIRRIKCRSTHIHHTRNIQSAAKSSCILEELRHRGFVQEVTRENALRTALQNSKQTLYLGIDPSAGSLHAGHLFPLLCLFHFHLRGHRVIPLIGGATGLVGDPSGRVTEREQADVGRVERNVSLLEQSVQAFFKSTTNYAKQRGLDQHCSPSEDIRVLSNLEWHKDMGLLQFLRTVGTHVRVNTMLSRESVQTRMASQQGISYAEFTYQLLQGYDFYHLNKEHGCTIQIGGSDQWGNIISGLELINRLNPSSEGKGYGIITPLLTTASGEKFGKSAGNAVWLSGELTSAFDFYQFFLRVADADVGKYLRMFTLMPLSDIEQVLNGDHKRYPERRIAQRALADEVTLMIHGDAGLKAARTATKCLFDSNYDGLTATAIIEALSEDPCLVRIPKDVLLGTPVGKLAASHGLVSSNSAARALVQAKGLYISNQPVENHLSTVGPGDVIDERVVVLRAGKDKHLVLVAE